MRACRVIAAAPSSSAMRPASVKVTWVVVDPDAQLDGHRHRPGGIDGRGDDGPEEGPVGGQRGAGALAGHLAGRAPEVEVDVVDADLIDQPADGGPHDLRVDAAQLDAAHRLVRAERGHGQGLGVALDQGPGGDHLAHVEPGPVSPAQAPEGDVGHPGHRGQHHRRVDLDGPEFEGGQPGGHVRALAHRSVMAMPSSARSERNSGRDSPITLPGSPSTPSMNGADRPSRVNAPATAMASPVAR